MVDDVIKIILMGVGIVFTYILVPYIKNHMDEVKYNRLVEFVEFAVRSAEQIFTKEENKEKKKYVYHYILMKSSSLGLNISDEDLDILIEGIVNLIKHDGDYISE